MSFATKKKLNCAVVISDQLILFHFKENENIYQQSYKTA